MALLFIDGFDHYDPQALDDLQGISGIGATKLERYGDEVLRVSRSAA